MLLIYQIKAGLCLIAFYLLWKLLLSRETFHRFNRVALLTAMALAMVLPWIRLSMDALAPVSRQMVILEQLLITPNGEAVQPSTASWSWSAMQLANVVYFIGLAAVLVWLLYGQWSLLNLMKKGRRESLPSGATLHVVPGDLSPFSYFSHIVINEQDYRDNPREILIHEQAHIGLRHSLDVVFWSVVMLFQWWNPAAWLLGRELRQVHEYEADMAVLNQGVDVKQYQLLLIKKSVGDQLFSMVNSFNYQSLKQRIRMMTMNKSSRWNRLRALAAIPVIALALLAFANPTTNSAVIESSASQDNAPQSKVYDSVEQMPEFPGGMEALIDFLSSNVHYPENAVKNDVEGRVLVQFVIEKTGEIGDVKVVRSVDEELDAEAVRVVKSMPKFEPGRINGKAVAVWYTLPIMFKLKGDPEPSEN